MDIWEPQSDDSDRVRAVRALLKMYATLYLRHSPVHEAAFKTLGEETIAWLRRGAPEHGKPFLAPVQLALRASKNGAAVGDSRLNKVLGEIARNLTILGYPPGTPYPPRGNYRVNEKACTFIVDGVRERVMLVGPTPADRHETSRRGALFLEPRFSDLPRELPAIVDVDLTPFASSTFQCLLEHPRDEYREGRTTLRALFGGLPLTLFGAVGGLSIIDSDDTEESYDEHLLAGEPFEDEASEIAAGYGPWKRTYAEGRLLDQEPQVTLDGSVRLHPQMSADKLVPVLDTWPTSLLRRIGFEFRFGDALLTNLGTDGGAQAVFDATVEALQARGPILRNDPAIGLVGGIDPVAEIGLFCESHSLTVTFQRRGDGDLWGAAKNFPLNDLLVDILRRLRPAGVHDDASL